MQRTRTPRSARGRAGLTARDASPGARNSRPSRRADPPLGLRRAKRQLVAQLGDAMLEAGVGKSELARRMGTSRSSLDRLLDDANPSVTLATLGKAARALGLRLRILLD